jgi:dihydroorotase
MDHLDPEHWRDFQMNPPIRGESDRQAMFSALKNGEIQFLATDHAPHTHEEKKKGTSGLTGLDSYGPFVAWLLKQGFDPKLISTVTAENPGKFFNQFIPSWRKIDPFYSTLGLGLGFLEKDYRASFTVLNLNKPLTLTQAHLKTKVQHNPFVGCVFPGSVARVFIGGSEV